MFKHIIESVEKLSIYLLRTFWVAPKWFPWLRLLLSKPGNPKATGPEKRLFQRSLINLFCLMVFSSVILTLQLTYGKANTSSKTTVSLPVESEQITIIPSVPKQDLGSKITDFHTAFPKLEVKPNNSKINIEVGREPVYVIDGDVSLSKQPSAESSPFGFHPALIIQDNPFSAAQDIGIRWHRGLYAYWILIQPTKEDIANGTFRWEGNDREWGQIPPSMTIFANIGLPERLQSSSKTFDRLDPMSWIWRLNEPEEAYIKFVNKVVERYDGDGIDDMPGLKVPIKYWQVENEPDLLGKEEKDWEGYAHIQEITAKAIKEADTKAKIALGGLAGGVPSLQKFFTPILKKLDGKYIDIFDFHYYGNAKLDWLEVGKQYKEIRKTLDELGYQKTEIWITEMGTYSGSPDNEPPLPNARPLPPGMPKPPAAPTQTEKQQAMDVVKRYVYSISLGVKKVFWAFGLMEGFNFDDGYFDHTGFIYDGNFDNDPPKGTKKLAYYTYKMMTQTLDGAKWDKITALNLGKDIYAYKIPKGNGSVTVLWHDPPYPMSDLLPKEKAPHIQELINKLKQEKTNQSNVKERFKSAIELLRSLIDFAGPSRVDQWAPRDKVQSIERMVLENSSNAPEEVEKLIQNILNAF